MLSKKKYDDLLNKHKELEKLIKDFRKRRFKLKEEITDLSNTLLSASYSMNDYVNKNKNIIAKEHSQVNMLNIIHNECYTPPDQVDYDIYDRPEITQ